MSHHVTGRDGLSHLVTSHDFTIIWLSPRDNGAQTNQSSISRQNQYSEDSNEFSLSIADKGDSWLNSGHWS